MNLNNNTKISSNRSFGILFFIVFFITSLWPLISRGDIIYWALIASLIFLVLGVLNSKFLTPLNKLWIKFGIFLGAIVSPIVMGIIYFIVLTPIGALTRFLGKDLLRINKSKSLTTYWINRDKQKNTMKKQF
jgi:predicted membrane metal-binding protein